MAAAEKPVAIRTSCGRTVSVGRLTLEEVAPIGRVVLRMDRQHADRDHLWASLTAAEARRLAEHLLTQAAFVERRRGYA